MFGNKVGATPEPVACAFDSNDGGVVEKSNGRKSVDIWRSTNQSLNWNVRFELNE